MAYMVDRTAPYSGLANLMALQGRMGDTELVHMSKPEIRGLQGLGKLTINPDTGLPEAFNLKSMLPIVGGIAGTMMLGPGIGTALGGGAFGSIGGAAIGSALGSFGGGVIAGQSIGEAAKGAAISGGMAGLTAGLFPSGFELPATPTTAPAALAATGPETFITSGSVTTASPSFPIADKVSNFFTPSVTPAVPSTATQAVTEPSLVSKALGFAKEHPIITSGGLGLVGASLMGQEEEPAPTAIDEQPYERKPVLLEGGEQVAALTPEEYKKLYTEGGGTQEQITSLKSPFRYVPEPTYVSHGGLIGLAEGGAVQKFLDSGDSPVTSYSPSSSPSTPSSASGSIDPETGAYTTGTSTFDKARIGLQVAGLFSPIAGAAAATMGIANAISNLTNPNVAVFSQAVPGQVQSSPFSMFSDQSSRVNAMRTDVAMDVDGPPGLVGLAASDMSPSGEQTYGAGYDYSSEGNTGMGGDTGNNDASQEGGGWKAGGLIGLANGGMVTIQPGDTLTKIANETGTSIEDLVSLNNITNPNSIQVGQQLKISEGDSGLDIASIKENIKDFVDKLSTLPEEARSGIMSILPESVLKLFNKDDTGNNEKYFYDIVKPLEFSDAYYKNKTYFNPKTNSYVAYKDTEGHLTFGPGVLVNSEIKKLSKKQIKEGSELPKDVIDNIALKRWGNSIKEAKQLTNLPDDKVKPFAEMVYQMGKSKVSGFTDMLEAVKKGDFGSAAVHAADSKWARQMDKAADESYQGEGDSTRAGEVANRIAALGFTAKAKGGNIGHYFEGQVEGNGDGQSDHVEFKVDARSKSDPTGAMLSVDEYVVPADAVAMIGNGSSNAGASKLDDFVKDLRKNSFGTEKQQKPYNAARGLSALV
jgi:LysM repeat protein